MKINFLRNLIGLRSSDVEVLEIIEDITEGIVIFALILMSFKSVSLIYDMITKLSVGVLVISVAIISALLFTMFLITRSIKESSYFSMKLIFKTKVVSKIIELMVNILIKYNITSVQYLQNKLSSINIKTSSEAIRKCYSSTGPKHHRKNKKKDYLNSSKWPNYLSEWDRLQLKIIAHHNEEIENKFEIRRMNLQTEALKQRLNFSMENLINYTPKRTSASNRKPYEGVCISSFQT